jgi:hypothetical protein
MSFEESQPSGSPHQFLARIAGGWQGVTRTWLEPEGVPSQSKTQGSIQLVLDGRFALYLYQGSVAGEPQQGMFTFGYNTTSDEYEASWVDSYHNNTAIMFCTGKPMENGFEVLGSYPDLTGGPDWGWRTEVTLEDADHLTIVAYNIVPDGGEAKAIESKLVRVKK